MKRRKKRGKKVSAFLQSMIVSTFLIQSFTRCPFLVFLIIRSRDLAFSALAGTSRLGNIRWLPHRLQTASLSEANLQSLYHILQRDSKRELLVKSFNITAAPAGCSANKYALGAIEDCFRKEIK